MTFLSRFAGDGESGLAAYAGDTFVAGAQAQSFEVPVVDPASLPSPDIVKIDIEGGEGDVLDALDLSAPSSSCSNTRTARTSCSWSAGSQAASG